MHKVESHEVQEQIATGMPGRTFQAFIYTLSFFLPSTFLDTDTEEITVVTGQAQANIEFPGERL